MSITVEAGLSTEKLQQVARLVKRACDEAVQLRIVERFLSEVERRLLKTETVVFDIERLRTALQILKTVDDDDDIEECLEAEFRLDQEFHLWRTLIIERDQKIETYHFRRVCDSMARPLDDEIFVALASFYRGLDFTPSSQSKFDLAVTRLFSTTKSKGRRELRDRRQQIVSRLRKLFETEEEVSALPSDIESAISEIDGFTDEAKLLTRFEDLVKSNIFDRYRLFKRELGPLFFEAEIVAAAVECNITVGNVFDELLRQADEQLSARLTVDVDLPSVLHDADPDARTHITELFKVFFGDEEQLELDDDIDHLGTLLSASSSKVCVKDFAPSDESMFVQDRLAPFLRTLTEARPNVDVLAKEMRRAQSLSSVDVNLFLYNWDSTPDVLCRRVLGLILWTHQFCESEMLQQKELTQQSQREANTLLFKAENLADAIRTEMKASEDENEPRLRTVLNCLLDARAWLKGALAKSRE
jgi:hypothetical protein